MLAVPRGPSLVVRRRRAQLPFGVQVGEVDQRAEAPPPEARRHFVDGLVDLEIFAHQVAAVLAAVEQPGEVDAQIAHLVAVPFTDRQHVALGADGLLDQGRGGGPAGVVEGGFVQGSEDALEGVVRVHAASRAAPVPARANRQPDGLRMALLFISPP